MRERRTTLDKVRYGDVLRGNKAHESRYMVVTAPENGSMTFLCLAAGLDPRWFPGRVHGTSFERDMTTVNVTVMVSDDE